MTEPSPEFKAHWQAKIDAEQSVTDLVHGGQIFKRLRYGDKDGYPGAVLKDHCWDCGTPLGWIHVDPCCVEVCPCCGEQLAYCDCRDWEQ
jgi:hypothetical protein